jgi:hypothetical protein
MTYRRPIGPPLRSWISSPFNLVESSLRLLDFCPMELGPCSQCNDGFA